MRFGEIDGNLYNYYATNHIFENGKNIAATLEIMGFIHSYTNPLT
jgi:hypothetical protein